MKVVARSVVLLFVFGSLAVQAPAQMEALGDKILTQLRKTSGAFTPEVRKTYVEWAEAVVLRKCAFRGVAVPKELLAEIHKDPVLSDAMFAAVYPPDASILQNYLQIRGQLGPAFTAKYRSLAIAVAVGRRTKGLSISLPPPNPKKPNEFGQDNQPYAWEDAMYHPPKGETEWQAVRIIANFMQNNNCSGLDLYTNADLQKRLAQDMKDASIDPHFISEVKTCVEFGERIKAAMIQLRQRPSGRDPLPMTPEWLKHLVSVYESKPKSVPNGMSWPLFPLKDAPWPLMMSFSRGVQLSEAKYIYNAFQGDYGDDRFHTYGPYHVVKEAMPDMLRPSKWFWNAFPDHIIHGGVCVEISKATIELYAALGLPSVWAGQPGHANLISFRNENGLWKADIEQDFAGGPFVTYAQWLFGDEGGPDLRFREEFGWPAAEYHLGMAAGMNLGLTSYIDSRIVSSIYQALPAKDRVAFGTKLLAQGIQINPFNPDLWFRYAKTVSGVKRSLALVKAAQTHDSSVVTGEPTRPAVTQLSNGPAASTANAYWKNLEGALSQFSILAQTIPTNEDEMQQMYSFLRTVPGVTPYDIADYMARYISTRPPQGESDEVKFDSDLADKGDLFGLLRMGQRCLEGGGVPVDEFKAKRYLSKASRQGEPVSAVLLERLTPRLPTDGIEVVASSVYSETQGAKHLIDGSGMVGGVHDNSVPAATMWQSILHPALTPPGYGINASPAWVRFRLNRPLRFDAIEIWNHNQADLTDRGFKRTRIYGSYDNKEWFPITEVFELPRASGEPNEPGFRVQVHRTSKPLKYVIIAAEAKDGNYGGNCYGLSAVRFVMNPIAAAIPSSQIRVRASSIFSSEQDVQHLIDGAGMVGLVHDNHPDAKTMWLTSKEPVALCPVEGLPASPAWVRFNFAQPRKFEAMLLWNYNQSGYLNRGFKNMRVYGTSDGVTWFPLTNPDVLQLPQGDGKVDAMPTTITNAAADKELVSVIVMAQDNYEDKYFGLSAVRFLVKY